MSKQTNRLLSIFIAFFICFNNMGMPVMAEGEEIPEATEEPATEVVLEEMPTQEPDVSESSEEPPAEETEQAVSDDGESEGEDSELTPEVGTEEEPVDEMVAEEEEGSEAFANPATDFTYTINSGKVTITKYLGNDTSVEIPSNINGYPVTSLGNSAFSRCSDLTIITIPDSVTSIGEYTFEYCTGLTSITIPNSVTSMGGDAFSNCSNLISITIPSSVTSIGYDPFGGCDSLSSITVDDNNRIYDSRDNCNAIIKTSSNTLISGCKNTVIPNSVTSIDRYAFSRRSTLTDIIIPNSVTSIANAAFAHCTSLTNITIPSSITRIVNDVFYGCTGLTSVTIPNSVTRIDGYAFYRCSSLTSINIPNSVTSIGRGVFSGCTSLASVTIPNSVTSMENDVFLGCSSLTSITIPSSVTSLGYGMFGGCSNLSTIRVDPNNSVYDSRDNCNGIIISSSNTLMTACKNTVIPNSITKIDGYAYYYCDTLTSITIPSNVTSIGYHTFEGCDNLSDIYFTGTQEQFNSISSGDTGLSSNVTVHTNVIVADNIVYKRAEDNTLIMFRYLGDSDILTIPDNVGGSNVISIDSQAFQNNEYLTTVTIPNTVQHIGEGAFDGCNHLQYIYFDGTTEEWAAMDPDVPDNVIVVCISTQNLVNELISNIASIGTVTLASAENIAAMRQIYDTLDEAYKPLVSNYEVLVSAEQVLVVLVKIDDLSDEISLEDKASVKEARAAYDALTDEQKILITNLSELVNAEEQIKRLDQEKANEIIFRIDALGEITVEDKSETEAIRAAYEVLDEDQKALVTNYDALVSAEETIAMLEELLSWGDVLEEDKHSFANADEIPEGIWAAGIPESVQYDGTKKNVEIRVYDHKTLLKNKTDYTVTYKNTVKAYHIADPNNPTAADKKKAPQVIIKTNKKGNYSGTKTIYFSIDPVDLNDERITVDELSVQATGKTLSPVPTVYFNGKKLKNKTDFTVSYENYGDRTTPGERKLTITGKGNYTGSREVDVHVASKDLVSVAKLTVSSKSISYADLTGDSEKDLLDRITVKNGKKTVLSRENGDYSVEDIPSDYARVGTVSFTIIGNEAKGYYGRRTVYIKITGISLSDKKVKPVTGITFTYNGSPWTFGSETNLLTYNGNPLTEGVDYEIVSYAKNVDAGKATVTVKGINNYTGTKKVTYTITPAIISEDQLIIIDDPVFYCKGGSKPGIYVVGLTEGKDYTVKYSNNTKANAYGMAVITFKGNYKGSSPIPVTFYIKTKDIADVTMTVKDKVYSSKANGYKSKPVLKDVNGKTLKAGTDYETTYQYTAVDGGELPAVVEAGTVVKVTVTGKGNYTGTISEEYWILNAGTDISKMTFKINSKEYTGSEITIEESDITSIKLGKKAQDLKLGTDYEIAGYSNNVKKGTAKVTFRGINGYGGTKTVKFKISQRNIGTWWQGILNLFKEGCTLAGKYWYDNECHDEPKPTAEPTTDPENNKEGCNANGKYWHNNMCINQCPEGYEPDENGGCKVTEGGSIEPTPTPLPTPSPAEQCANNGGTWNGSTCVYPPSPAEQCANNGGTWNGNTCVYPPTPAEECANNGGTWDGHTCVYPPTPAEECANNGGTWDGRTCVYNTSVPGVGGEENTEG